MAKSLLRSTLRPLVGGMKNVDSVTLIGPDEAYKVVNMHIDRNGLAFTRKGSRLANTTALAGPVTSIYDYQRPDGSGRVSYLLVTADKYIYKYDYDIQQFIQIHEMNSADRPTWATFLDGNGVSYVFLANGTDFLKYNGDTVSDATSEGPWTSAPRYIMEFDNRLLATGCDSDPYVVWVSELIDGTDWVYGADSETAHYWTMKGAKGDRVTGLGRIYNYCAIFREFGTTILTGSDPESTDNYQIEVSERYGSTSHWSIQAVGSTIYFADRNHLYRGVLRAAVENGLEVYPIDDNVQQLYKDAHNHSDIVSVYDAEHEEIQWAIQSKSTGYYDTTLVYNVPLSGETYYGRRDVWSGYWRNVGYNPHCLALVQTDNKMKVWRGDRNGYVTIMGEDEQYKDETYADSAVVENDIPSEILTGISSPQGVGVNKYVRHITPIMYQRYDDSVQIEWIVDGRYILPTTAYTIGFEGTVAYWTDGTGDMTQLWNTTIWNNLPVHPVLVTVDEPFNYLQIRLYCDGTNARDEMAYAGCEIYYQMIGVRKVVG